MIIDVCDVRKRYGATVAVDGIDLAVDRGEILGMLGANGAGKTTLVECIAGLRTPDSGSVRVAGMDPRADRSAFTPLVGVQLQRAGLQAKLTVREALDLYASFYSAPRDGMALAQRLALDDRIDTQYGHLSGGQQQRLAIALALIGRPQIALLDELTTGLDPRSRRDVWELIDEVRQSGTTIILVTHLMEEAQRLCDRLAVIDDGRLTALDTPEGLVSHSPVVMTFAPSPAIDIAGLQEIAGVTSVRHSGERIELIGNDNAITATLDWLAAHGVRAEHLRVSESTLEDAYLELTTPTTES